MKGFIRYFCAYCFSRFVYDSLRRKKETPALPARDAHHHGVLSLLIGAFVWFILATIAFGFVTALVR